MRPEKYISFNPFRDLGRFGQEILQKSDEEAISGDWEEVLRDFPHLAGATEPLSTSKIVEEGE